MAGDKWRADLWHLDSPENATRRFKGVFSGLSAEPSGSPVEASSSSRRVPEGSGKSPESGGYGFYDL